METYYYDLHVFYDRKNGFSVLIKIETEKILTDNDVIMYAVNNKLIDSVEAKHVDYVTEIEEDEYNDMKGQS